jgi:hypothetical protein
MLVNGVYPGPTLRAKWGDWIVVNVKNNLRINGTGIHWHGIRQYQTCQHDGVPGISMSCLNNLRMRLETDFCFQPSVQLRLATPDSTSFEQPSSAQAGISKY